MSSSGAGASDKDSPPSPAKSSQTPPRPAAESLPIRRRLNLDVNTSPQRPRPATTPLPQPQVHRAADTQTIFSPPQPQWTPFHPQLTGFRPIVYQSPFGQGSFYFPGTALVPVGSSSGGVSSGGVGQSSGVAQKRKYREGSASPGAGRGRGRGSEAPSKTPVNCSVCNKAFSSQKALFGHMRSHPDRGWKGAHPPPTFNAEEEFADMPGVNLQALAEAAVGVIPEGVVEAATGNESAVEEGEIVEEEEGQIVEGAAVEAEGDQQDANNEEVIEPQVAAGEAEAEPVYLLPDLNDLPPPEDE
jgi:hypothetical protein